MVWQVSQAFVVGKWVAGLPIDLRPSWQETQAPNTSAWSIRMTGLQAIVPWQLAQVFVVRGWAADLPAAVTPS